DRCAATGAGFLLLWRRRAALRQRVRQPRRVPHHVASTVRSRPAGGAAMTAATPLKQLRVRKAREFEQAKNAPPEPQFVQIVAKAKRAARGKSKAKPEPKLGLSRKTSDCGSAARFYTAKMFKLSPLWASNGSTLWPPRNRLLKSTVPRCGHRRDSPNAYI